MNKPFPHDPHAPLCAPSPYGGFVEALNEAQSKTIANQSAELADLKRIIGSLLRERNKQRHDIAVLNRELRQFRQKSESELIADDLRHLARQGGPAWSCLLSLADRAERLK